MNVFLRVLWWNQSALMGLSLFTFGAVATELVPKILRQS